MNSTLNEHSTEFTLRYSSTRSEVANWYWRAWKKRLWKYHFFIFACALASVVLSTGHWPPSGYEVMRGVLFALAVLVFLVSFPQIAFKPQVRTLILDRIGIRTEIGRKTGAVSWGQIESVTDSEGMIVIARKNMNAFLVPQRAFSSEEERSNLLSAVRTWMELKRT